jgi:hypothetical protein
MTEPVGSGLRGEHLGNSHKQREKEARAVTPEVEREPVEKIVTGKVRTRKQPWYKRATGAFIAEDAQSLGDYLLVEVIVPAIKNLVFDVVTGGTSRTLYGGGRRRSGIGGGLVGRERGEERYRTRYDRMGEARDVRPARTITREARARHDFDDVYLDDRAEAVAVIEMLMARVEKFGAASVGDMYEALGVTGSFADLRHGWYDLTSADVRQERGGWKLVLPPTEPLSR